MAESKYEGFCDDCMRMHEGILHFRELSSTAFTQLRDMSVLALEAPGDIGLVAVLLKSMHDRIGIMMGAVAQESMNQTRAGEKVLRNMADAEDMVQDWFQHKKESEDWS